MGKAFFSPDCNIPCEHPVSPFEEEMLGSFSISDDFHWSEPEGKSPVVLPVVCTGRKHKCPRGSTVTGIPQKQSLTWGPGHTEVPFASRQQEGTRVISITTFRKPPQPSVDSGLQGYFLLRSRERRGREHEA